VGLGMLTLEIVDVICCYQRQTGSARKFHEPLNGNRLGFEAVVLQFQIEPAVEDIRILAGAALGILHPVGPREHVDLTPQATRETDQARAVTRQNLLVDPRLVVETLQVTDRRQPDQVLIALEIPSQKDKVIET